MSTHLLYAEVMSRIEMGAYERSLRERHVDAVDVEAELISGDVIDEDYDQACWAMWKEVSSWHDPTG